MGHARVEPGMQEPRCPQNPGFPATTVGVLALLGDCPDGVTEANMIAHGFTAMLIAELIIAGFASASVDQVRNGKRKLQVTRLKLADAGRQGDRAMSNGPSGLPDYFCGPVELDTREMHERAGAIADRVASLRGDNAGAKSWFCRPHAQGASRGAQVGLRHGR
jgi:hypothetical protein